MNKSKHIRPLLFLILFPVFISCSFTKEKTEFLPKEFDYPTNQIGNGKTFIYSKVGEPNQTTFKDIKLISESGKQFLISKKYSANAKSDSIKTSIDGKLVEIFTFMSPDNTDKKHLPIKGEIKKAKVIDNGTKLGQMVSNVVYTGNENVVTISSEGEYLKDTVHTWIGKQLDCIVISIKSTIEFSSKTSLFKKHEIQYNGDFYFAKGIGLIRYSSQTKKDFSVWELIEIKDTK